MNNPVNRRVKKKNPYPKIEAFHTNIIDGSETSMA